MNNSKVKMNALFECKHIGMNRFVLWNFRPKSTELGVSGAVFISPYKLSSKLDVSFLFTYKYKTTKHQ